MSSQLGLGLVDNANGNRYFSGVLCCEIVGPPIRCLWWTDKRKLTTNYRPHYGKTKVLAFRKHQLTEYLERPRKSLSFLLAIFLHSAFWKLADPAHPVGEFRHILSGRISTRSGLIKLETPRLDWCSFKMTPLR